MQINPIQNGLIFLNRCLTKSIFEMLKEKAGTVAGLIWNTLNGTDGLTVKQIKKATKLVDKDIYLGFGWLLKENKVTIEEIENDFFVALK
jgi:hypothetical protein